MTTNTLNDLITYSLFIEIAARCLLSTLTLMPLNTIGLQSVGLPQLLTTPDRSITVLSDSFAVFTCMSGYTNIGGSLNVTCNVDGTWSTFPNCVRRSNGSDESMMTTTTTITPLRCVSKPFVPNAYISNETLVNFPNNAYQGQVYFTCNPGYRHVNTSGTRWVTCTNGVWSALPVCEGMR